MPKLLYLVLSLPSLSRLSSWDRLPFWYYGLSQLLPVGTLHDITLVVHLGSVNATTWSARFHFSFSAYVRPSVPLVVFFILVCLTLCTFLLKNILLSNPLSKVLILFLTLEVNFHFWYPYIRRGKSTSSVETY